MTSIHQPDAMWDYQKLLEEYQRRQMLEHLTGPMISLVLHVVLIVAAVILITGRSTTQVEGIVISTKVMELTPLEPEFFEKFELLEPETNDLPVPQVDVRAPAPAAVDVSQNQNFAEPPPVGQLAVDYNSLLEVKQTAGVLEIPTPWGGRDPAAQKRALDKHAGPHGSAIAIGVVKALNWLRDHQESDGSWSPRSHSQAMTGLALLTFLAHGETPAVGNYQETVKKAINRLVNSVMQPGYRSGQGYEHAIVTYALCEAYGLTRLPMVKAPMEKGLTMIVNGQQPGGGWDYNYAKGERWDLSVSAWQMQALEAGLIAGATVDGLEVAIAQGVNFVKNITYKNGRFGYAAPGQGSWGMTSAGALVLQLCDDGRANEVREALKNLHELNPEWRANQFGHGACYGWYYITQALFHGGRRTFHKWNSQFAPLILANQDPDGHWDAPPADDHSATHPYAPYYNTCMNALSLQVYYRILSTSKVQTQAVRNQNLFDL